jgi:hypothetical protein
MLAYPTHRDAPTLRQFTCIQNLETLVICQHRVNAPILSLPLNALEVSSGYTNQQSYLFAFGGPFPLQAREFLAKYARARGKARPLGVCWSGYTLDPGKGPKLQELTIILWKPRYLFRLIVAVLDCVTC